MNSFNLAFIFEQGPIVIIKCFSENELDREKINFVATKYFKGAVCASLRLDHTIDFVIRGVQKECGCNCEKIVADAYVSFPRKN